MEAKNRKYYWNSFNVHPKSEVVMILQEGKFLEFMYCGLK